MPKGWISSVDAVYLQKWKLDKKCILFRISNKIFQTNFLDGSMIFIKSNSPIACFKSSKGEIVVKNTSTEQKLKLSHPSFAKRIEYVRNLLLQIMNSNNKIVSMGELDEDYEEEEYLYTDGLKTKGRQAKMEKEYLQKIQNEKKVDSKEVIMKIVSTIMNVFNQYLGQR